jgi:hypothetical protein
MLGSYIRGSLWYRSFSAANFY